MNEAATVAPRALRFRASKFDPVRLRADAVVRDRLLQRLAAAANTPIVLISASAGYGKSTLAAQWSAHCQRPVAWINIDRGDNDPVVFLNSLAHALDRIDPLDPQLLEELSGTLPRLEDVVLPAFAAELDRLAPFELILDDAYQLSQLQCLEALTSLLEEIRPPSQAVLVTQGDPELPLARHRASGRLLEIRADELALNVDETRELVAFNGKHLSAEMLELLHERTEGWPAGIALALHTLDESAPVDDIAQTLSGGHREIADYLTEVILYRETEERRRFLLATSVLTQMTPPLCDAVLGVTGSSDVLAELERSNSFVIALDDHRGWYRYHHLFAELLRTELERVDPELAVACLSRAATWYEQSGDPGEAFRCAHECGDLKLAGRAVMASTDELLRRGRIETVKLWLLDCTDEEISSDPQLAIVAAWVHLHLGDSEGAQRFAAAAGEGDLDAQSTDGAVSLRSSLMNLRTVLAPDGIQQMLADAEFVCAAEGERRTPVGSSTAPGRSGTPTYFWADPTKRSVRSETRSRSQEGNPSPPTSGSPASASSRSPSLRLATGGRRGSRHRRRRRCRPTDDSITRCWAVSRSRHARWCSLTTGLSNGHRSNSRTLDARASSFAGHAGSLPTPTSGGPTSVSISATGWPQRNTPMRHAPRCTATRTQARCQCALKNSTDGSDLSPIFT